MDWSQFLSNNLFGFITGLIGAVVGGYFTLCAANKTIIAENEKEARQDAKEVLNMLSAMHTEISTLWDFHMNRVGAMVENLREGDALEFYYPLTQDYFTVYHTNAEKLGKVENDELRKAIVVCYNKCKKVVDGFKYNNEIYTDHRDLADSGLNSSEAAVRLKAKHAALTQYAMVMKADHFELKAYVEKMLTLIEKHLTVIAK